MNELKNYLKSLGAVEVGFADISDVTPINGLNKGIVFYITYPAEVINTIRDAPSRQYLDYYDYLNDKLDDIALSCEQYLINKGYDA